MRQRAQIETATKASHQRTATQVLDFAVQDSYMAEARKRGFAFEVDALPASSWPASRAWPALINTCDM